MRLLFDEQLAEELCDLVRDAFPDSLHVRLLGRGGASDDGIWQLAREHGCVLVTKDEDFVVREVLRKGPPVVWIRLGNTRRAELLRRMDVDFGSIVIALERGETLVE